MGAAVHRRKTFDIALCQSGNLGHASRDKTRQHLGFEPLEAGRVGRDIAAIDQAVAHQNVHDPERQSGVAADADLQVPIGLARGAAFARVDDDDLDAATAAHGFRFGPEMYVGGDEVSAPGDDQVTIVDRLGVGAGRRPDCHIPGFFAARVAHRAGDQPAGAKCTKQAQQQTAVQHALMRAVGVAEQRLRPRLGDDRLPAEDDLVERLVPVYRREFRFALWPDPAQRRLDAQGRMDELHVAVDLGAGKPRGERLLGVARDAGDAPLVNLGQ